MKNPRFGVFDIGSLKVKLLIAEKLPNGEFQILHQSNTLTMLGVRVDEKSGQVKPQYLQDTIDELLRCKTLLKQYEVSKVRAVSTHTLRELKQGKQIAKTIKQQTGFSVDIISQQEEAELFFNAVLEDFKTNEEFALIDVGGGSVQLLIGNKNHLKQSFMLPTGASFLHDKFIGETTSSDTPSPEQISKIRQYIQGQLATLPTNLNIPLIYGSSCIIDVFKTLNLPLKDYSNSPSHPHWNRN